MIGNYAKTDFDKLRFPIHLLKEGETVLGRYSSLRSYPEFKQIELPEGLTFDQVMRYIIYHYDPNSPLRKEEKLHQLKVKAAMLAGFKPDKKDHFHENVVLMMQCKILTIVRMSIRYLRIVSDMDMTFLRSGQDEFYNMMALLNYDANSDPSNAVKYATDKIALRDKCETMLKKLKSQAEEIFAGDTHLINALDLVYQDEDVELIGATIHEKFARKRSGDDTVR